MELKIYVYSKESEMMNSDIYISNSANVQMSLTSFNPLTGADRTSSYSASITAPMCLKNDRIFGGWKNFNVIERHKLKARISAGGIMLPDEFRVQVKCDGADYHITLVSFDGIAKKLDIDYQQSNNINGFFGEKSGYITDMGKMLKGLVLNKTGLTISYPTDADLTRVKSNISTIDITAAKYMLVQQSNYCVTNNDNINSALADPYSQATIALTFTSNIPDIVIDARDIKGTVPQYVVFKIFDTDIVANSAGGGGMYEAYFRLPQSISFNVTPNSLLEQKNVGVFEVLANGIRVPFEVPYEFSLSSSASKFIPYNSSYGEKNIYKNINSFCALNFLSYRVSGKDMIFSPILSDDGLDYSSKMNRLVNICESDNSGNVISLEMRDYEVKANMSASLFNDEAKGASITANAVGDEYWGRLKYGDSIENYFITADFRNKYQQFINNFSSGIEVEITANLSIWDIIDFDQTKRYYFSQFQSYFYITSISGYNLKTGECKIKMLKLN